MSTKSMQPALWDPLAAWRGLDPAQQEKFGVAALVMTCGDLRWDHWDTAVPVQGWDAAQEAGANALQAAFRTAFAADPSNGRPDLAAIGTRFCRVCGCTDDIACSPPCCWVETNLCSACADSIRAETPP